MLISERLIYVKGLLKREKINKEIVADEEKAIAKRNRQIEAVESRFEKNNNAKIKLEDYWQLQKEAQIKAADKYQNFLKKSLWAV
jgi:hypothetical protein